MNILKFGGTSVATAERILGAVEIVKEARERNDIAVVVSALGGVTDVLLKAAHKAAARDETFRDLLTETERRHLETTAELVPPGDRANALGARIREAFGDLQDLLRGTFLLREASPRILDSISSYGERLSAGLFAEAAVTAGLGARACDARRLVVTGPEFGAARVDIETTYAKIREHFREAGGHIQVITGYIGATPEGRTTTLGRGGSDYTAAIFGAALAAHTIEIWTDVPGVMSADPRLVPDARPIERMSYDELMELSHFGAKVVYPPSVRPARERGIRLAIKSTLEPRRPGTLVSADTLPDEAHPMHGIASIPGVALLRFEGTGMVGVPGIARRLFGALARENVNVILISQASSEHSICFAVASEDVTAARQGIEEEFALERRLGQFDPLVVEEGMAVVAAVGAGMRNRIGIAGRIFGVLGAHGINVRAISQGSSELNISLVVDGRNAKRAVLAMHDAFLHPERRTVEIAMVGVGRVGGALLRQLAEHRQRLVDEKDVNVKLTAVVGRHEALIDADGLDENTALERLRTDGRPHDLDRLAAHLLDDRHPHRVFIDCTASPEVPRLYDRLLTGGVHVVTANKLRVAGSRESWESLRRRRAGRLYFETTVGAGLPVVITLEYLLSTGDRVERLEGVLSGTLGFLADRLAAGRSFSDAVREAYDRGYTEPDPREDLSGNDVGRKLLILARITGRDFDPSDVSVEGLLPDASWHELGLEEFWERLPELDATFAARQAEAVAKGEKLCYLGRLGDETASVALRSVRSDHPCYGIRGTDNLIGIYTRRYRETPLVVQGPGAGPEVTAAGVFGDLLRAVTET